MIAAEILIAPTAAEPSAQVANTQTAPTEGADFAQVLAAEVGESATADAPVAAPVNAPTTAAVTPDAEPALAALTPSSAAIIATLTVGKGPSLPAVAATAPAATSIAVPATATLVAEHADAIAPGTPAVTVPGEQTASTGGEALIEQDAPEDTTSATDAATPVTSELAQTGEQTGASAIGDTVPTDPITLTDVATDGIKGEVDDAAQTKDKDQPAEATPADPVQVAAGPVAAEPPLPLQTVSSDPSAPVNPALAGVTDAQAQTDTPDATTKDGEKRIGTETVAPGKGRHRGQGGMMGKLAGGLVREASTESDMQARATKLGGKAAAEATDKTELGPKAVGHDEDARQDAFSDQLADHSAQPQEAAPEQSLQDLRSLATAQGGGQGVTATTDRGTAAQAADQTPVDVMQQGWEAKLGDRILSRLTEHGQEIEMDLNPENLGSVRIKMELTDGNAQVRIITDTTQAAQVFQQAEGKLAEALNKAGVTLSSHDTTSRDTTAGGQQRGAGNGAGNGSGNGSGGRHDGALANLRRDQADIAAFTAGRRAAGIVNIVA